MIKNQDLKNKFIKYICLTIFLSTLIYTVYSLFSYSFFDGNISSFLGIHKMQLVFADLRQLTHSSGCEADFSQLSSNAVNCDPFKRPFNYTRISLWLFRILKINQDNTSIIGLIMGLITIISSIGFIFETSSNKKYSLIIFSLFIISYPLQFCLERGNYDQFILFGSILLPIFYQKSILNKNKFIHIALAAVTSFGITALKLFPFLGIFPWTLMSAIRLKNKNLFYIPLIILISSFIGFLIQIGDLSSITSNTPQPFGVLSFGFRTTYFNKLNSFWAFLIVLSKLALILISIKLFKTFRFYPYQKFEFENYKNNLSKEAGILFSFMIIFTYFLNNSYDYRLIFILGIIPIFTNMNNIRNIQVQFFSGLVFICFEQYLRFTKIGEITTIISDTLVQPLLIAFLITFLLATKFGGNFKNFYFSNKFSNIEN